MFYLELSLKNQIFPKSAIGDVFLQNAFSIVFFLTVF